MRDVNPAWDTPFVRRKIKLTARKMIGRCGWTQEDEKDLIQDLTVHVWMQLPRYDPTRSGLNTFISRIVENKANTLAAREMAAKRDARCVGHSLNTLADPDNPSSDDHLDALSSDEHAAKWGHRSTPSVIMLEMNIDLSLIYNQLSSQEQRVLDHWLNDVPVGEMARDLGVHRSTVYDRIASIRKRIQRSGYGPTEKASDTS